MIKIKMKTLILALLLSIATVSSTDVPGFIDEHGYECIEWTGYDCATTAIEDGYSAAGVAALLESCCITCDSTCPPQKVDNPTFTDEDGYICSAWANYLCSIEVSGYTEEGHAALLDNCCESCDVYCGAANANDNDGLSAPSPSPTPVPSPSPTPAPSPAAVDNPNFTDAGGHSCYDWVGIPCTMAESRYTAEDHAALLDNCCATCGTTCIWANGTASPSPSPVDYQPEDCVEVSFTGCFGLEAEPYSNGFYEIYAGACPGAIGGAAYYNLVTGHYMYKLLGIGWLISDGCGFADGKAYVNTYQSFPFLITDPHWKCVTSSNTYVSSYTTIKCTRYDGQSVLCKSGTFSPTGVAPNGDCQDKCPAHRSYSRKGNQVTRSYIIYIISFFSNSLTL